MFNDCRPGRTQFRPQMASLNAQKHHRYSIRLPGYDYSQAGAYFVTIVTQGRECLFGEVVDGEMVLNHNGQIVQKWWDDLPICFPAVETGAFVIMPNHVHGIIAIVDDRRGAVPAPCAPTEEQAVETMFENFGGEQDGGETPPLRRPKLGQIVAYFKHKSTKEINSFETGEIVAKVWQRNYFDHIIRDERDMDTKWNYIESNPCLWPDDDENPFKRPPLRRA